MNAITPRGKCPSALAPMATGDGLLVRVHPPGAALTAAQMRALADGAATCGNGLLDLSSRGNVQIRGVRPESQEALVARLSGAGLIDAVDRTARPHAAMVSPLTALDPSERLDMRPIATEIDAAISGDPVLSDLPPKFAVVADGGGLSLDDVEGDVRLVALDHGGVAVALASPAGPAWIGRCAPADSLSVIRALALAFAGWRRERDDRPRRIRDLAPDDREALAGTARPWLAPCDDPPRRPAPIPVGEIRLGPDRFCFGFGLPFGRGDAALFRRFAEWSEALGGGTIRVSPWRSLLLPNLAPPALPSLVKEAAGLGLIVDADDPRGTMAACPGAPACTSATTDTQADAARLAAEAGAALPGLSLHLSGCAKGCARQAPADLTLVGASGRYGVVVGGNARATVGARLTIDEIAGRLRLATPGSGAAAERLRRVFEASP